MTARGRRTRADVSRQAWAAMRTLVLERHDRRATVADRLGMSFIRAKALMKLAGDPLTMSALATVLAIDPPYATLVVGDLERRGLVRRSPHRDDRRVKLVSLTEAGRAFAATAGQILDGPPSVVDRLSDAELAELARIVAKLSAD